VPGCAEACGSAPYWARQRDQLGHTVKPMAPQFVKPDVRTNQHAAGVISEALSRPSVRFVPLKSGDQQAVLHRARQGFGKARTAQASQVRGVLAEFGIGSIVRRLPELQEDRGHELPGTLRQVLQRWGTHLKALNRQVDERDVQIKRWHRENAASCKLAEIPGIGRRTTRVGGIDRRCQNIREWPAVGGVVLCQYSSGGKQTHLGISQRGDGYLRMRLLHGARAAIRVAKGKLDPADRWLKRLGGRRQKHVAAVAFANQNARVAWALLAHHRAFRPGHVPANSGQSAQQ
jgi:transposase